MSLATKFKILRLRPLSIGQAKNFEVNSSNGVSGGDDLRLVMSKLQDDQAKLLIANRIY